MRNRTGILLSAALAFALTAISVANTGADSRLPRGRAAASRPSQSFDVSGVFTGVFGREIQLGTASYRLAPNAMVYEIGRGLLPLGTLVTDRYVFLSGLGSEDAGLVYMVIVRPAAEMWPDKGDPESHIRVRPTDDESSR